MALLKSGIDFILHFDKYLGLAIQNYGALTYIFLFIIIFCETGLVITPFLPGDSLIFIAGTFAASGLINITLLFIILSAAAILGDSVNYAVGKYLGHMLAGKNKLVKKEYIERTEQFYKKHGGKAIILARFVPIVRTFAPFVAGVGRMEYSKFFLYNVIGGISWVSIFLLSGYFFGGIPIIKNNLEIVIILIIAISLLPPIFEYLRNRKHSP